MVVAHHYWGFDAGYAGVGFFFVLSGYVLAINYPTVERASFWWKRFARIYPMHALAYLLALPLGGLIGGLPSIVLLQSWVPLRPVNFGGNGPSWSISNEAFFYAFFPFLVSVRGKAVTFGALILVTAALLWGLVFPSWTMTDGGAVSLLGRTFETPLTHFVFYVFPPTRLFEFVLGMYLAKLSGRAGAGLEAAALAVAVASVALLPFWPPAFQAAIFFIPASALLIYVFSRSEGPIARLLSNKPLVILGDASFALYMIHYPFGAYFGHSIWTALAAIATSVLLFFAFEKPVQRKILAFRRPKPARMASVSAGSPPFAT